MKKIISFILVMCVFMSQSYMILVKASDEYQGENEVFPDWVMRVELDKSAVQLRKGESVMLSATVLPETALNKNLIWKSSDESVATVDRVENNTGIVVANNIGNATIYAISENGSLTAECSVEVVEAKTVASGRYEKKYDDFTDPVVIAWLLDELGVLWISGYGALGDINYEDVPWFSYASSIKSVVAEGEMYSFCHFSDYKTYETVYTNLENVHISTSASSNYFDIGGFMYCESLENFEFETTGTIRSLYAREGAFYGCVNLMNISASGNIEFGLESDGYACVYNDLDNLASIKLTGTWVDEETFSDCDNLIAVSAPKNTEIDENAFHECDNVVLYGYQGSYAETYAGDNGIPFVYLAETEPDAVAVNGITIDKTKIEMSVGECERITATVTPQDATNKNIIWISSDNSVATIDGNGNVTAHKPGVAHIVAMTEEGGYVYNCKVSVDLVAYGICKEDKLRWSLDTYGTLRVFGDGAMNCFGGREWESYLDEIKRIIVEEGIVNIERGAFNYYPNLLSVEVADTVTSIDDYAFYWCEKLERVYFGKNITDIGYSAFTYCDDLTIYGYAGTYAANYAAEHNIPFVDLTPKVVMGVTLDKVNIELNVGETTTFTATVEPESVTNKNIIWSSSDSSVAVVNENGKVTAVSEGTTVITVTTEDGGYTANCTVKVVEPVKIIERGTCGENAEWTLDEFGVLTIAGTGSMIDFESSGTAPWYLLRAKIKTIVVQSGISYIGAFSFTNLIYTKKAIIADSVTGIGKYAFYKCTSLTEINLPQEIESINFYAFFECDALVDVYADSIESWCSIKFEDRYANPLYYAENLWVNGDVVTSVVFPEGASSVNDYLFCGYEGLTNVTLPDGVKAVGNYSFFECENLLDAELSKSMLSIGNYAFHGCEKLSEIMLAEKVNSIGVSAFHDCDNLTIYGYAGTYAEEYALENSIVFVDIATTELLGSGKCGDALTWKFDGTGMLTISGTGKMYDFDGRGNSLWDVAQIKSIVIENGVTYIGAYAFADCVNIESIVIPDCVEAIGEGAFAYCRELADVQIGKGLSEIKMGTFFYCASLESITIPDNIATIGEVAFGACVSLTDVDMGSGVTYIEGRAFENCIALKSITLPANLSEIGQAPLCGRCTQLEEILVNEDNSKFSSADGVLFDFEKTKLISYPYGKTSDEYIVPSTVNEIGYEAFFEAQVEKVIIPESVTAIREAAFYRCENLSYVLIPASVTVIEDYVFEESPNLIIYGYAGSYAQTYATENNVPFVVLPDDEKDPITYSFGQSVQIGLIEPWFIKANLLVYTDSISNPIDYGTLVDYGAYFIRKSELSDSSLTQSTITNEDVLSNPSTVKKSKHEGTATIDGSFLTANYDKGIYTYEMSDSLFVLFYVEDENGIQYAPVRERNIKNLLDERKNNTESFKNVLERNVYDKMSVLETDVGKYRAQFSKITKLPDMKAPKLSEYVSQNGVFEEEKVKTYTFGNSVQLVLVEPWGLKVNALVQKNGKVIDYNAVEEYGAIVFYDTAGKIAGETMTAEELRTKRDAYVFSSKAGDATIDGSFITAVYNKGIYTYQLDSNAYVMFYVKDADGYHYGDVKVRNAYELAKSRGVDTSGNFGELEKIVYQDMENMYETVTAYRDDYFSKN